MPGTDHQQRRPLNRTLDRRPDHSSHDKQARRSAPQSDSHMMVTKARPAEFLAGL